MKIIEEFKQFIARGNVIDLAVGVIIGAAFGKIVTALVNDLLMPPIGQLTKGINFNDLFLPLDGSAYATLAAAKEKTAVIAYGSFVNTVIEFLIVAFCVFLLVKAVNALRRKQANEAPPPAPPTKSEVLLEEIRDLLKKGEPGRPAPME